MQFKLISRTEQVGSEKRQLQFSEIPTPDAYGMGINLSGYFDAVYADALTVGSTYELTLTEVV